MRIHNLQPDNTIYFCFLNANPPSMGYKLLLDKLLEVSKGSEHIAFINPASDSSTHPLKHDELLKFCKKLFPNVNFYEKADVKNPFQALKLLSKDHLNAVFFTRDDQVRELSRMSQYAESWGVQTFDIVGAGDSRGGLPENMRRQSALQSAKDGDYDAFKVAIPSKDNQLVSELYLRLRNRMLDDGEKEGDEKKKEAQVESMYAMLKIAATDGQGILSESTRKDDIGNHTVMVEGIFDSIKNLKLVFSRTHRGISVGTEESRKKNQKPKNYVMIMGCDIQQLSSYLDLHETRVKNAISKLLEFTSASNIASVPTQMFTVKRNTNDVEFDVKSYPSKIAAINAYIKENGGINPDVISSISRNWR